MTLADDLAVLQSSVSKLKADRDIGPLQNDIYEAVDDLCHLGQRAVVRDTRINYHVRAESDLMLFQKLRDCVSAGTEKERVRYLPLLDRAEELLQEIGHVPLPPDGHLGVLKVIRHRFDFLFDEYAFTVVDEQPTRMRLASGAAAIELGWATQATLSFSISRAERRNFWIEDLLYLYGDQRYQSVPQAIQLNTESDVNEWFGFISSVLRQYGDELLRGKPGAFDRLEEAQTKRDAEYIAMMNEKYGVT